MCLPKLEGGLGIKNIERFNLALSAKWRWRLLRGEEGLWVRVLRARYGRLGDAFLVEVGMGGRGKNLNGGLIC